MHAFTNKLIEETSPYLLQHAHNPVNWYPWGGDALQRAIDEDKPILVSIGYSACHWCHVMERESFENEETAMLMNENFINIKIDREERPDLDHIYMDAVQAISGSGGWPLNVFLTPGKKPFYGGTYFPPQRAFNRASWPEVLIGVSQLYKDKRGEVEAQADELIKHIERTGRPLQTSPDRGGLANTLSQSQNFESIFTRQQCEDIFKNILINADKKWGGFGSAPKFPQTFTINYLLRYYHYTKNEAALQQACLSLDKMLQGGIYDQIVGGFARYATDAEWLAPHFEKMLYDNALIISSLCDAYQLTKIEKYKKTVEQTISFIIRELADKDGGFYAALDADSEGVEGKFYVWSFKEVNEILGDEAKLFCEYYDVTPNGNWEHTNILRVLIPPEDFAQQKDIDENKLEQILSSSAKKLLDYRSKRIRPSLDDKILLSWNAIMITALCKASAAFNNEKYKNLAIKNFEFLIGAFRVKNDAFELFHTYKNGIAKYPAFLDDYACLIEACINLQEITSDQKYLEFASSFTEYVLENFASESEELFFFTSKNQNDIVVRKKEIYDGAVASGNSVMAKNLLYLSLVFNKNKWHQKANDLFQNLLEMIIRYPTSFGNWACIFIDMAAEINELAIVGKGYQPLRDEMLQHFMPNKILQCAEVGNSNYPLLADKPILNEPLIYLCKNYACLTPVKNVSEIVNQTIKQAKFT